MTRWNHNFTENGGYIGVSPEQLCDPYWDNCVMALPGFSGPNATLYDLTGRHTISGSLVGSNVDGTGSGQAYPYVIRNPPGQTVNAFYLTSNNNVSDFIFPGDFGMGGWFYWSVAPTGNNYFQGNSTQMTFTTNQSFSFTKTGGGDNGSAGNLNYVGGWHHFWWSHIGQTSKLFYDGALVDGRSDKNNYTDNWTPNASFAMSANQSNGDFYFYDFRVYNGVPVYTDSFVPPKRAFIECARKYPPGIYSIG